MYIHIYIYIYMYLCMIRYNYVYIYIDVCVCVQYVCIYGISAFFCSSTCLFVVSWVIMTVITSAKAPPLALPRLWGQSDPPL